METNRGKTPYVQPSTPIGGSRNGARIDLHRHTRNLLTPGRSRSSSSSFSSSSPTTASAWKAVRDPARESSTERRRVVTVDRAIPTPPPSSPLPRGGPLQTYNNKKHSRRVTECIVKVGRGYLCRKCKKVFEKHQECRFHIYKMHIKGAFCGVQGCGAAFSTPSSLKRHMQIHGTDSVLERPGPSASGQHREQAQAQTQLINDDRDDYDGEEGKDNESEDDAEIIEWVNPEQPQSTVQDRDTADQDVNIHQGGIDSDTDSELDVTPTLKWKRKHATKGVIEELKRQRTEKDQSKQVANPSDQMAIKMEWKPVSLLAMTDKEVIDLTGDDSPLSSPQAEGHNEEPIGDETAPRVTGVLPSAREPVAASASHSPQRTLGENQEDLNLETMLDAMQDHLRSDTSIANFEEISKLLNEQVSQQLHREGSVVRARSPSTSSSIYHTPERYWQSKKANDSPQILRQHSITNEPQSKTVNDASNRRDATRGWELEPLQGNYRTPIPPEPVDLLTVLAAATPVPAPAPIPVPPPVTESPSLPSSTSIVESPLSSALSPPQGPTTLASFLHLFKSVFEESAKMRNSQEQTLRENNEYLRKLGTSLGEVLTDFKAHLTKSSKDSTRD